MLSYPIVLEDDDGSVMATSPADGEETARVHVSPHSRPIARRRRPVCFRIPVHMQNHSGLDH